LEDFHPHISKSQTCKPPVQALVCSLLIYLPQILWEMKHWQAVAMAQDDTAAWENLLTGFQRPDLPHSLSFSILANCLSSESNYCRSDMYPLLFLSGELY
jgi:hypothetical protein